METTILTRFLEVIIFYLTFYKLSFLYKSAMVVAPVVAHLTTEREVPGSIPAGSWAFFSSLSYQKHYVNQVLYGGASLLIFLYKMISCAA